jgi:hypothetical protein
VPAETSELQVPDAEDARARIEADDAARDAFAHEQGEQARAIAAANHASAEEQEMAYADGYAGGQALFVSPQRRPVASPAFVAPASASTAAPASVVQLKGSENHEESDEESEEAVDTKHVRSAVLSDSSPSPPLTIWPRGLAADSDDDEEDEDDDEHLAADVALFGRDFWSQHIGMIAAQLPALMDARWSGIVGLRQEDRRFGEELLTHIGSPRFIDPSVQQKLLADGKTRLLSSFEPAPVGSLTWQQPPALLDAVYRVAQPSLRSDTLAHTDYVYGPILRAISIAHKRRVGLLFFEGTTPDDGLLQPPRRGVLRV